MTDALPYLSVFVLTVFLALLLREAGFKGAKLVSIIGMILILFLAIDRIGELKESLDYLPLPDSSLDATASVLKIIGVGYVFGISADICKEMGENGVASCLLVAGRVEILMLSFPFLKEVFSLGRELIK